MENNNLQNNYQYKQPEPEQASDFKQVDDQPQYQQSQYQQPQYNQYQQAQPEQPQYNQYQQAQPEQPQYNQYQQAQPEQPQYNQYQQAQYQQQPQYNQYQQPQSPQPGVPAGYEQKSKLVAGLLGIFVGSIGVHNFYLGFTKRGVLQIVLTFITAGLAGIWGFIEGILYLTGSKNVDANGIPLKNDM